MKSPTIVEKFVSATMGDVPCELHAVLPKKLKN